MGRPRIYTDTTEDTIAIACRIHPDEYQQLRVLAAQQGKSIAKFIRPYILKALEEC
jgi:predicted DNA-binding protein